MLIIMYPGFAVHAQLQADTAYYRVYPRHLTTRFYFSRKYTSLQVGEAGSGRLRYRPNTTWNMGVGATYRWATVNLAYGFGFLNPERGRGRTRYLDLQFHRYGRAVIVDVLGQFYRGFYRTLPDDQYRLRPDLRVQVMGATVQYVLNYRRFSYRAAFLQNEWQRRTAGSWMVGASLYAGQVRADSTWLSVDTSPLQHQRFIELGPSIGYAYTWVYREHWYITGAATLSLDAGVLWDDQPGHGAAWGFRPNALLRLAAGYAATRWVFNVFYVSNSLRLSSSSDFPWRYTNLETGQIRLQATRRLQVNRKMRRYLRVVDDVEQGIR